LSKLKCKDFGFKCEFVLESQDVKSLIREFRKHTFTVHEMAYSEEIMKQHIVEADDS